MQCPSCRYVQMVDEYQCPQCRQKFKYGEVEQLARLDYLRHWLDNRQDLLPAGAYAELRQAAEADYAAAEIRLRPAAKPLERELEKLRAAGASLDADQWELLLELVHSRNEYKRQRAVSRLELLARDDARWRPALERIAADDPEAGVRASAQAALQSTFRPAAEVLSAAEVMPVKEVLPVPEERPAAEAQPAAPAPVAAPAPIDWRQVWARAVDLVASGLLLRGLLYLGAFMVVAAALVLVIAFWNVFPVLVQIGFIAAVPLAFYAGGFGLRTWLKITQAGTVFTGIGALLIAVDFAAVYQLLHLAGRVDVALYWLLTAAVCAGLYALTTWRLPTEFFGAITLIAAGNVAAALAVYLTRQPEWWAAAGAAAALGMTGAALGLRRASPRYAALLPTACWLAEVWGWAAAAFGLAAFGYGQGAQPAPLLILGVVGTAMNSVLAAYFPARRHMWAAAGFSLGAAGFALRTAAVPLPWAAAAGAALAPGYLGLAHWLARRRPFPLQAPYQQALEWTNLGVLGAATLTALGLLLSAALAGARPATLWGAEAALVLAVAGWTLNARRFHSEGLAGAATVVSAAAVLGVFHLGHLPALWYGAALALAAPLYAAFGRWGTPRLGADWGAAGYRRASYGVALLGWLTAAGLGGMELLQGSFQTWRMSFNALQVGWAAAALGLAALDALAGVWVFRRASLAWAGAGLGVAAVWGALRLIQLEGETWLLLNSLLAAGGYLPLGLAVRRWPRLEDGLRRSLATPFGLVGYWLGLGAAWLSLGQFWFSAPSAQLILVLWLFLIQLVLSQRLRLLHSLFAWTLVLLAPDILIETAVWLGMPAWGRGLMVAGLVSVYVLSDDRLARWAVGRVYRGPLRWVAAGLVLTAGWLCLADWVLVIARLLAAPIHGTLTAPAWVTPLTLTCLAAAAIVTAGLHRTRWPVYSVPWLMAAAGLVLLYGYAQAWLGRPLFWADAVWLGAGLAVVWLLSAAGLDPRPARYAHGLYFGGYGLGALAVMGAVFDPAASVAVTSLGLAVAALSAYGVQRGAHRTWDELITALLGKRSTWLRTQARAGFLWLTAWALPAWAALVLWRLHVADSVYWLGLSGGALLLLGWGAWLRRVDAALRWPLFSAAHGYTGLALVLSVPFALLVFSAHAGLVPPALYPYQAAGWLSVQALAVVFYIAAARVHAHELPAHLGAWTLVAGYTLAWRSAAPALPFSQMPYAWLGLAAGLLVLGAALDRYQPRYAHGPYLAGYALVVWAVIMAAPNQGVYVRVLGGALLLALISHLWAALGRHATLEDGARLWPAPLDRLVRSVFWLSVVAGAPIWFGYSLSEAQVTVPMQGVALILLAGVYGGLAAGALRMPAAWRQRFYLELPVEAASFVLLGVGVGLALRTPAAAGWAALAALGVSAAGAGLAAGLRRVRWASFSLLAAHLALFAYLNTFPAGAPRFAALPFHALTWGAALVGLIFSRRAAAQPALWGSPAVGQMLRPAWARPFWVAVVLDMVLWQFVAAGGADTTFALALGHALLLALLATVWQEAWLAYGALGALTGAALAGAVWQAWTPLQTASGVGALSLGLYLWNWLTSRWRWAAVWAKPVTRVSLTLSAGVAAVALIWFTLWPSWAAAALGWAGLVYLTAAVRQRHYPLGYLGVGLLLGAWSVLLWTWEVAQPQFYAAPAGVYLVGISVLERRQGRRDLAHLVELLGLSVLLITTFIQSVVDVNAVGYVLLLVVEGAGVVYWGAARRVKRPFFIGIGASVLNVLAQVVVLFAGGSTVTRWLIIGAAGLILAGLAVLVERQRNRLIARAQAFALELERWD